MTPKLIEPGVKVEQTREIPIYGAEFLIGRGNDCDLRLRDANVSRHHCLIHVRPQDITLTDLGSSNGTFVNGQRIFSQVSLEDGDEIRLAEYTFLLDLGEGNAKIQAKIADVNSRISTTLKMNEAKKLREDGPGPGHSRSAGS